jgi:hypothetical protein
VGSVRLSWPAVRRTPVVLLVVLQVAAIVVVGVATVARFHIFAGTDEQAHVAYVEEIATHGQLPWLGRSVMPAQLLAMDRAPSQDVRDPRLLGFGGLSWEAFQPPLYYALAVPAFVAVSSFRGKVFAVRAFDLLLLLAGVALLAFLARAVLGERWQVAFGLALSVLLWPGVVARAITVSNEALEIPIVLLYLLAVWYATDRERGWVLVCAGGLLGLCVLTQLTLICLAPLLVMPLTVFLRARQDRQAVAIAALTIVVPLVLVAPWLISNEARYGALTASSLAQHEQRTLYRPTGTGLGLLASVLWRLPRAALPEEWWSQYGKTALGFILRALPAVLVLAAAVPVVRRPRLLLSRAGTVLVAPFVLGLATLVAIVLLADWPSSFLPRFLNPMLAPFALFAAWASLSTNTPERRLFAVATAITITAAFVWIYMAGAYYFTNVGASLGIHAA